MSQNIKQFNLLVSCPSDVMQEYGMICDVVDNFNRDNGEKYGVRIQVRHWYTDSYPQLGKSGQDCINEQVVDKCDLAIAVFWTKLGTPTEKFASGTVEEIERLLSKGRDVFLYFSDCPISPTSINIEQYEQLLKAKKKFQDTALYFQYSTYEDFIKKLSHNIPKYMERYVPELSSDKKILADNLFTNRNSIEEIIVQAQENIFVSGVTLSALSSSPILEEKLKNGLRVRIVCQRNEDNLIEMQSKLYGNSSISVLKSQKEAYFEQLKDLENRYIDLEVRECDAAVSTGFIGIDLKTPRGFIQVQHYLYKFHINQGPCYICHNSEVWYEKYENLIESIWNESTKINFHI